MSWLIIDLQTNFYAEFVVGTPRTAAELLQGSLAGIEVCSRLRRRCPAGIQAEMLLHLRLPAKSAPGVDLLSPKPPQACLSGAVKARLCSSCVHHANR